MDGAHLLAFGHAAQDLARDVRQQGIGENVVYVPCPALHFSTTAGNRIQKSIVVGQLDLVILQDPALDLAQLQPDDLLQGLIR